TNRRRGVRRLEGVAHDQGAGLVEALGVLPELREHRGALLLGRLGRVARDVDEQHVLHGSSLVAFSVTTNGGPGFRHRAENTADSLRGVELRTLGTTGVKVSPLCLGAMMFGAWGETDHDEAIRIIHRALDAGINFIDTADVYSRGESEEIVGKALRDRRDDVILATKVHGSMGDDPN